jgi:hypothetical protein
MWWILTPTGDKKFPYRLRIEKEGQTVVSLYVQDRWPGQKGHIFCIQSRDEPDEPASEAGEIERIPIISLKRYGKRIAVVLDRSRNKRCDFLFLTKNYKTKEGEYEQIFWRTQKALTERRPRVKLTTRGHPWLHVAIDSNEKYPWRFTGCTVTRESLPVGDYALKGEKGILAVVERKTMANLLQDFGNMAPLHQALGELEAYEYSALVLEADYANFLKPKLTYPYRPTFTSKAIGELFTLHPGLQIVFAGNRKMAKEWTLGFFSAIRAHEADRAHPVVREAAAAYRTPSPFYGGAYYDTMKGIMDMPSTFTMAMVREQFPTVPEGTIRRALQDLKKEGKLSSHRAGRKSYWERGDVVDDVE